jgi:2-amino-4-hydroxy-6-hydroxymethyldihydropteridine diphosphokinase
MLDLLQSVELHFGRHRRGQRWQARTLDLDIILWSGGMWISDDPSLAIPHPAMRVRRFVLAPACAIAPLWRDPFSNRTIRQLFRTLGRPKRLDRLQKRL